MVGKNGKRAKLLIIIEAKKRTLNLSFLIEAGGWWKDTFHEMYFERPKTYIFNSFVCCTFVENLIRHE